MEFVLATATALDAASALSLPQRQESWCYGVRLYNVPERYSEIASDYSKRSDS